VTRPADARVLVVNAGSSTLKLRVLGRADEITAGLDLDPWDGRPDHGELGQFVGRLSGVDRVDVVGHRVVHGGSRFTSATVIDDTVTAAIADLTGLAPLHQPRALAAISAVRRPGPQQRHVRRRGDHRAGRDRAHPGHHRPGRRRDRPAGTRHALRIRLTRSGGADRAAAAAAVGGSGLRAVPGAPDEPVHGDEPGDVA
jgi:acetate kinase